VASETLYTPEILGLATNLADYPWNEELSLRADARSKSCGSSISLGASVDESGVITKIGVKSQACAVGQAAAAIFAKEAVGKKLSSVAATLDTLDRWLSDNGPVPDWPGFDVLERVRDYPARHGAIKLPWQAATRLLSSQ